MLETIYITNDTWRAEVAQCAHVDRIMVDLEILGKQERQQGRSTVISGHSISDVVRIRSVLNHALMMVRINPIHERTDDEISQCLDAGADILMLPMFTRSAEVRAFVDSIGGRAKVSLLLETASALARINDILDVGGIDEVHIGLNDLHLALKLDFMFEIVAGGIGEYIASAVRSRGIKLGIGGVAPLNRGLLDPMLVLSEHVRLGSTQVILSRDFGRIFEEYPSDAAIPAFQSELLKIKGLVAHLEGLDRTELNSNAVTLRREVENIVLNGEQNRLNRRVQTIV